MNKEEWKDIKGFEGFYQVSSYGRIKRLPRCVIDGRGSYVTKENILKADNANSHGYITVTLTLNKKKVTKNVHRVVIEAFIPNHSNLETVNHIDGDKTNNNLCNLEWSSRSDNQKHAYMMGLQKPTKYWEGKFGINNPKSIPVHQICINTGKILGSFAGAAEASRMTKTCRSKITSVCKGQRKTSGGFKWRYANE